jgi:hypothetical protein
VELELTLGPLRVVLDVVIADIETEAILGMDFLLGHQCKLDLAEQMLIVQGTKIKLWKEEQDTNSCLSMFR